MKTVATLLTLCVALSMGLPAASLGSEPSTTSSGELTINNSMANIDSTVNGRVNVYASSTIKGTLTVTEPTKMTVKPAKLSGDLTITNAEGSVYLSMPKTESFRLNASLTEQYGNI